MKKIILITIMLFSLTTIQKAFSQVSVGVDINTFNTALDPYGRWVDYPQYGRVWICNEPGFRPYYNDGHWEYTEDGWTWVSDYPWGWAPFHYGRWADIDGYGWGWIPGYDWAPAWVSWCDAGDYYGWAPLGPGLGIDISIGSIPADRWYFVPHQYINSHSLRNYYVNSSRNADIYRNGRVINNIHGSYAAGPRRADVEKITHTRIQTRSLSYARSPGRTVVNHNAINIYRPDARRAATPAAHANNRVTTHPVTHNATHGTNTNRVHHSVQHPQQTRINTQQHAVQQHNVQHQQMQHHQMQQMPQQHIENHPAMQNHPPMEQHMERSPGSGGGGHEGGRHG
jgi:hypothetical protein